LLQIHRKRGAYFPAPFFPNIERYAKDRNITKLININHVKTNGVINVFTHITGGKNNHKDATKILNIPV
jgi:hypothetical protein